MCSVRDQGFWALFPLSTETLRAESRAVTCCPDDGSLTFQEWVVDVNHLTPNDHSTGRTAPLTSKRCILYIYSTNTGTQYFKHGIQSPFFFSLQNAVCFIILMYLVPVLFTFYIQVC